MGFFYRSGKRGGFTGVKQAVMISLFTLLAVGASAQDDLGESTAPAKSGALKNQASEKYDTKLPVEISSDNLEVLQNENKAIFKGNVIAVQGKIRLNADTMIVHYKQKDNQPAGAQPAKTPANQKPATTPGGTPASPSTSADAGAMGAITLIEVQGNVFAATPEDSAKGDKGEYQVPEKMLHLTGPNVILTRGKNILRGTELVYNLETGRSVLTNKGARVDGPNGGRVHGLFIPNQDQKDQGKDKDKNKPDAAIKPAAPGAVANDASAPATPGGPVKATFQP